MFYIDIDGTIALHDRLVLLRALSDHFALHIDDERLATLHYNELLQQPEALECRARLGDQEFDRQLSWVDYLPAALRARIPASGSIDGVRQLAEFGPVCYLTCRKPTMLEDTRYWLRTWGFPHPEEVLSALCVMNKWVQLAFLLMEQPGSLFLIDDLYDQLITEFDTLQRGEHPKFSCESCQDMATCLAERVTLVAFGAKEPVTHTTLSVISLPSWQNVSSDLVLEKGETYVSSSSKN